MVVILGCGYTGTRVAALVTRLGEQLVTTNRQPQPPAIRFDLSDSASVVSLERFLTPETKVLYSIPEVSPEVVRMLLPVQRVVYISTTGVYGSRHLVDGSTSVDATHPRVAAERAIQAHSSALILRPAAIYGPGRGIQVSMLAGTFKLAGDGSNFVSRIHVDDLAAHCVAALFSNLTGAYPVADDEPCESREIASFCASLLDVSMPESAATEELSRTRRGNRKVDGREIRRLLGIELRYPSYRVGIPASVERAL